MKLSSVLLWPGVTSILLKPLDFFEATCGAIDITGITISKIHELYHRRILNPIKLTSCYLDRINQFNTALRAVIEKNDDVLEIAEMHNIILNTQGIKLPLFGIPVLIQDDFATYDKMETTSGCKELIGKKPKADASFVKQLREAGAIILGKTNLSEMSGFGLGFQGYSSRGGKIINPFNSSNYVYGSSSGAAVALATSMATVVFGNSMLGGISGPASAMGLIGFNPTKGFIPTDGLISSSESTKNIGFMAKNMEDIILLSKTFSPRSYFRRHENTNFYQKGLKVGFINSPFFTHSSVEKQKSSILNVFAQLHNNGVNIIEINFDFDEGYNKKILDGVYYEYENEMYDYLSNNITNNDKLLLFSVGSIINEYEKKPTPQYYPEYLLYFIKLSTDEKLNRYNEFLKLKDEYLKEFETVMDNNELDVLILTSQPETYGTIIPSLLGVPMISMPVGRLPTGQFGLSFFTRREKDSQLLELATHLEKIFLRTHNKPISNLDK